MIKGVVTYFNISFGSKGIKQLTFNWRNGFTFGWGM